MSDGVANLDIESTGGVVAPKLPGGATLPFPPTPSASVAGRTLQESTYAQRVTPPRLHRDSPNIVIVLIDDAGPGLPTTFGGEVRTATMDRICAEGVSYNRFHTTAMCSPTRASLLTGRNHHEIGNGQIAELANDWDGYAGKIPRSSALVAEVLKDYGYSTGAWGKWHNTPAEDTTAAGPFEDWPTGLGFEYFYGFLAGEASQYEPHLVRNTTVVRPPKTPEEGYHLSEDLADDAINWLRNHKALQADKPFFMYWASGCLHGPHHIMKEWADRYAGQFDDGWDAYRQRVFERAKDKGWIPQDCELTDRDERMKAWDDIPEDERPFQRRLMEVAAGFAEHVDVQVGRIVDELDRLGYGENTLFLYIWGDNGSSAEGQDGTIAELLAQNGIPTTPRMHIDAWSNSAALTSWAHRRRTTSTTPAGAGRAARHIRVSSWSLRIWAAPAIRSPSAGPGKSRRTLYRGITSCIATMSYRPSTTSWVSSRRSPSTVCPKSQSPEQVSPARSLTDRRQVGRRLNTSRSWAVAPSITTAGWPRRSVRGCPGYRDCHPESKTGHPTTTAGSCTTSTRTGPRPTTWPPRCPSKLAQMRELFAIEAARNPCSRSAAVCGCRSSTPSCASHRRTANGSSPAKSPASPSSARPRWETRTTSSPSKPSCPPTRAESSMLSAALPAGSPATSTTGTCATSTTCFILSRTRIRSTTKLPPGPTTIVVETRYAEQRPAGPLDVTIRVGSEVVGEGQVPVSAPLLFTANDCFDIGVCLGSPVSLDYYEKAPFPFDGRHRSRPRGIHLTHRPARSHAEAEYFSVAADRSRACTAW